MRGYKIYQAKSGPFSERPFYSDSLIEKICVEELKAAKLYPPAPAPIRIDRFAEKRFGVVPSYHHLPDGVLGLTEFGPGGVQAIIVARFLEEDGSRTAERRIRTTIAHESGHGLLHAHLFAIDAQCRPLFGDFSDPSTPKVLCRDPQESARKGVGYDGRWWEYQANRAIGALLLPHCLVAEALDEFLIERGLLRLKALDAGRRGEAIDTLVKIFDVNPVVARIRLNEMYGVASTQNWL